MKTRVCRLNTFGLSVSVCGNTLRGLEGRRRVCAMCSFIARTIRPGPLFGLEWRVP